MSQISPPIRILLVGCIVFMAAYYGFLRPGGDETATAPAPVATTAPAKDPTATTNSAVGGAVQGAVRANNATDAAVEAAAGDGETPAPTASAPTTTAATGEAAGTTAKPVKPSEAAARAKAEARISGAKGLPLPVAKAVASNKVLVLLFWNPRAADDRLVRHEVKGVGRHKGRVVVHVANVEDISRYTPITRGVEVQQSPSVVVVDRKLQGELLTGFTDRVTIDQAVSDALRATR
jgi:hypothetical protein